ncbi:hypothetical protein CAMGR0001_1916 [Campylobacter gracilis RM3268]|uniref:Uncharacterized protein n=1 Tax=Campylobacter gracilis RM3268 TaxID=553220 RepID=C8PLA7_9BACT|nr:hypothetical protein CAMGR0001_1916 [Campylobacter gracilis RM3268]
MTRDQKFYLILAARCSIGILPPRKRLKFYVITRAEILPPPPRLKLYRFSGGGGFC